ncbi:MAG: radical SAM family heme chaperone HemW [Clostridia bacterium]|nr:radical SAM family heme chaperone HemW [Clostridia bacterium]
MPGIYVHIPFCRSKCSYCDFTSFPDKICYAESYMACVFREMAMRKEELKGYVFDTVYIGGGTPSVIDPQLIAMLMAAVRRNFRIADNPEITIEMNPGTVSAGKIDTYLKSGINRFSVGLQAAQDRLLEDIGRIHNFKDFQQCARLLRGCNFNADVMIGLKGQSIQDILDTIDAASAAGASHISMYALTPEEGTPIYTDYLNGELPDEDTVAEMYDAGVKKLRSLGFERYEVSNFCKRGKESRHNLNYWRRGEYIGFGVSASSCINNIRFTNTFDLDEYFKCIISGHLAVIDSEEIDREGAAEELVMLALRTAEGLDTNKYFELAGEDFFAKYADVLERYADCLDVEGAVVKIKDEYLFVQNSIICDFLQGEE